MTDNPRSIWERLTVAQREALCKLDGEIYRTGVELRLPRGVLGRIYGGLTQHKGLGGYRHGYRLTPLGLAVRAYGELLVCPICCERHFD